MKRKLLSIILCLAMALSLLPTAALADEGETAKPVKVGETEFETLEAAIADAEPVDGVITYEISGKVNVTDTGWVQVAKTGLTGLTEVKFVGEGTDAEISITGDLAILADQIYDINVSFESLKLSKPNPAYGSDYGHSTNYFTCWLRNTNQAENTVTYTNCTFPNGVCNNQYGKTVFTDCKFENTSSGLSNLWNYGGETKVENCTFTGTRGIKMYNEGTLETPPSIEIKNTSFTGMTEKAAIVVSKAANVTLDTVGATNCTKSLLQKDIEDSSADQKVTIEANGTGISGDFKITANKAPEAAKTEFNISAGTFNPVSEGGTVNITDYLAPGANYDPATGKVEMSYVAKIGGNEYATLADAIAAAKNGDTIKLLKDVTNGDGVIVPSDKKFTLDFDNHTYTVTQKLAGSKGTESQCFQLLKNSTLTFKNGTIKANNVNVAMIIQNYSNLTLENMLLDGASITRNDATYTMSNNHGVVVIEDSTITAGKASGSGSYAFDVCGFDSYDGVSVTVKGSSVIKGDIEISRSSNNAKDVKLALESGTINGELKIDSSIKSGDATAITKTENVSLLAPSGYTWTKVGNTGVLVKEDSAAVVNGVGYTTLAAAVAAAKDSDTVTLLKDVAENVTIPANKTITLDLNGYTLSGGKNNKNAALLNEGTVTIKDSSAGKAGTIKREDDANKTGTSYYVIKNLGTMTIEQANVINNSGYKKTNPSGSMEGSSLICNGDRDDDKEATLTINDGVFEQQNFIAIKNGAFGILNVNGGKFTSKHSAIQNWYKADIKGGEINGQLWTDAYTWKENGYSAGVTKISGATKFTGEIVMGITLYPGITKGKIPTLEISGGEMNVTNWHITSAAANAGAKPVVTGGSFSTNLKKTGYLADSVRAEVKSADGSTYSYYTSMDDALAAAKPGDTVTDLKATIGQKVTLTLKYNDGATADTTYNVASGRTITLPAPAHRSGYTFNGWYDGSKFYAAGASYTVSAPATLNASWSYISSGSSSYDPTYSVSTPSKTENGTVTVSPKNASKGDTVTVTVKPDSGYVLETLTVTDKNGNELTLKDKGNGKYTFTMPAGKVEVKATFMEDNSMLNFFYDVPNNAYFYEAVKWAVENGITTGVGNDLFAPEQPCTRAQIVTFLWRAAGSPEPKGTASGMTDVVSGSYYEKAVAWAIENGITTGTTTSTFSPDATCTRAQAVTFLARALNAKAASAAEFSDVPTDSYFADAVAWAAANGVTEGIGGGLFGSDNDCTRGQIVTFLWRAYNK